MMHTYLFSHQNYLEDVYEKTLPAVHFGYQFQLGKVKLDWDSPKKTGRKNGR